jgi:hypothetical protein
MNPKILVDGASKQRTRYRNGVLEEDRIRILEAINGWTWEPDQDYWEQGFQLLVEFQKEFGHASPPQSFEMNGFPLGSWASHQRIRYITGKMDEEETSRFQSLGKWSWDSAEDSWNDFYEELKTFAKCNEAPNPPKTFEVNGLPLGSWASRQRVLYKKGKLRQDRISKLDELEGWTWNKQDEIWELNYAHLVKYVGEFGTATPPQSYRNEEHRLGTWINSQRQNYRKGNLSEDKAKRLESLPGWRWNPLDGIWESTYKKLLTFADEFKHTSIPVTTDDPELKELAGWVRRQRQSHRQKVLDVHKIRLLESLPGWSWKPHDESWDMYFQLLKDYQTEFGHALVSQSRTRDLFKGHDLATWVNSQRTRYKKGGLESDRILKLETIDGWSWDPLNSRTKVVPNTALTQ